MEAKHTWRVVRSFSMGKEDCAALLRAQDRITWMTNGRMLNESEVVRAGIRALLRLQTRDLENIVESILRRKGGPQ